MKWFGRFGARAPEKLPAGSFVVDSSGEMLASTLPADFLDAHGAAIAVTFRNFFRAMEECGLGIAEIEADYAGLKILAREMRGGVMVFLAPRNA